jgi:dsDNA-specific endonuclease/ATPase MutS2
MPQRIVRVARQYLSGQGRSLQQAIEGTLDVRRRAEQARLDAEQRRREAENAKSEFERQRSELERRKAEFDSWTQAIARLRPGDKVCVRRFEREGTVVRVHLHKQTALVVVGALEFEVPLAELRIPPSPP